MILIVIPFACLRPDLLTGRYKNRCFLITMLYLIVQNTKLQISTQKISASASKNTGVAFLTSNFSFKQFFLI